MIHLDLIGDRKLQRQLNALETRQAKTAVNRAMRESAKRLRPKIAAATPVDTGALRREMLKAPIRVLHRRGQIGVGIHMPTREALGIPPGEKGYYPNSVEYGFVHAKSGKHVPARSYVRRTVDTEAASEHGQIGRDIGREIERRARG